jgi:hypothetical protein
MQRQNVVAVTQDMYVDTDVVVVVVVNELVALGV